MMRSTFAGFTTATSALYASQRALEVVGQNIANVNTEGYTRQRLDTKSLYLRGSELYNSYPSGRIGFGVEITGVSQLRDPFLDNQYRSQMAKLGTTDALVSGYEKLANYLDETDSAGIQAALADLNSQLQNLSNFPNSKEFDSAVRSSCQSLLNLFHQDAVDLKETRSDLSEEFINTTVKDANELLKNIAELNETIKNSQILGNAALELMDERNMMLDELASYLPITTNYRDEPLVQVVSGKNLDEQVVSKTIEVLDIYFTDSTGTKHLLVSDNHYGSFEAEGLSEANDKLSQIAGLNQKIASATTDPADKDAAEKLRDELFAEVKSFLDTEYNGAKGEVAMDGDGNVTYTTTDAAGETKTFDLVDAGNYTTLEAKDLVGNAMRLSVTVTDRSGNLSGPTEITEYVPDGVMKGTMDMLNKSGGFDNPPTDVNGVGYYEQTLDSLVATFARIFNDLNEVPTSEQGNYPNGTPLFEKINPNQPFSVSNIKIADGWANNEYGVWTSKDTVAGENGDVIGSTGTDNVLKMIEALSATQSFYQDAENQTGTSFYKGTFYSCFTNMANVLNIDLKAANNTLENRITVINQTADLRDAISGVSLDEEGVNLLHFQQSYSAAARLMTTLDEALDKLINSTGVVGR